MKIRFLGTGAPDWYAAKGFVRRNAAVLLDDTLLVDPGPDVPDALRDCDVVPEQISRVLVTHTHGDHYAPATVDMLSNAAFYGSETLAARMDRPEKFTALVCGVPMQIGDYEVTAVRASHAGLEIALHFIICHSGKTLFYGNDGVWFTSEAYSVMKTHRFDGMILDATVNGYPGFFDRFQQDGVSELELTGHNCASMTIALRSIYLAGGLADERTVFVANHLAFHGFPDQSTPQRIFEPHGFIVPEDGSVLYI